MLISTIARRRGMDRKTVRKLLDRGLAAPAYAPREPRPRSPEPYEDYLAGNIGDRPDLSGRRLFREIRELGYDGSQSAVTAYLRTIRPDAASRFKRCFETKPGEQVQTDFADEPGTVWKVRLFSFFLGCHMSAFDACRRAMQQVLEDRMKIVDLDEDDDGPVVYNPSLVALLNHYESAPRVCKAYRAKTMVNFNSSSESRKMSPHRIARKDRHPAGPLRLYLEDHEVLPSPNLPK